jgi:hypothetical protein
MYFDHIAGERVTDFAIDDHRRRIAPAQQRIAFRFHSGPERIQLKARAIA